MEKTLAKGINKNILFLVAIVIVLVITTIVLVASLQTDPIDEVLENDQMLKTLIVLETGGQKTENKVLFTCVLMYYPVSRRVAMFDIPGNTGAIYSSLGRVDCIDAVYLEKGIDSYRAEIEKMLDTTIPFSIVMDMDQFSSLTDLLGGLRVFISNPVDEKVGDKHYLLPSGAITLDGDKIRTYLEYTVPDEVDSDVQERKQMAMLSFLTALNKKASIVFTKKGFAPYVKCFKTSLDYDGLFRLLSEISMIDAERLVPQTITGASRVVDGKTLLFPYYDGQLIKDVCKQTMSALVSSTQTVYSRTYVLEILNGTMVQGLARNTSALLQSVGYDVLTTNNADRQDYDKTVIIDHIGNSEIANSLGEFIQCENIVTDEVNRDDTELEADSLVDFTIILGKDFDGRYVR